MARQVIEEGEQSRYGRKEDQGGAGKDKSKNVQVRKKKKKKI